MQDVSHDTFQTCCSVILRDALRESVSGETPNMSSGVKESTGQPASVAKALPRGSWARHVWGMSRAKR